MIASFPVRYYTEDMRNVNDLVFEPTKSSTARRGVSGYFRFVSYFFRLRSGTTLRTCTTRTTGASSLSKSNTTGRGVSRCHRFMVVFFVSCKVPQQNTHDVSDVIFESSKSSTTRREWKARPEEPNSPLWKMEPLHGALFFLGTKVETSTSVHHSTVRFGIVHAFCFLPGTTVRTPRTCTLLFSNPGKSNTTRRGIAYAGIGFFAIHSPSARKKVWAVVRHFVSFTFWQVCVAESKKPETSEAREHRF